MNDLDEDVEWGVSGNDDFGAFREERVDDGLQSRLSGRVRLTLDTDHVHLTRSWIMNISQ